MVFPIKLMIAEEEKFQGKALSLSHTKTAISTMKEKFSQQQLRRFEESCFGHLLLIEELKWTSPIVHGLLLRKADPNIVSQVKGQRHGSFDGPVVRVSAASVHLTRVHGSFVAFVFPSRDSIVKVRWRFVLHV